MGDSPDDATSSRSRRMATFHWSQPCTGLVKNPDNTQRDLSRHILHELSTAHSFLIDFRIKYAQSAMDSTQDNAWEALLTETQFKYDFLNAAAPENPNDFNSQLLHAYEKMQRLAVGHRAGDAGPGALRGRSAARLPHYRDAYCQNLVPASLRHGAPGTEAPDERDEGDHGRELPRPGWHLGTDHEGLRHRGGI
ncbi:uncharacterized protein LOC135107570 isoform X2 [Scylla paramamosain]